MALNENTGGRLMLTLRLAKIIVWLLICFSKMSCAGRYSNTLQNLSPLLENDGTSDSQMTKTLDVQKNSEEVSVATKQVQNEQDISAVLRNLGVHELEVLDVGFYGKLGASSIFVADRSDIPNYDRLYWAMVRILSEKYGCFIRQKVDRGRLVSFKCRNERTVTMARKISGKFAMLHVRQFDRMGAPIEPRIRPMSRSSRFQASAKQRVRGLRQNP